MTRQLTTEELETAEALGLTPEKYAEAYDAQNTNLEKGTYAFNISSGKVEIITSQNIMNGAIQANLRLVPLDANGAPAKRFQAVFMKITLPVKNGSYVPTDKGVQIGIKVFNWLSAASGMPVPAIVNALKSLQVPAQLIGKTVVGDFSMKADKKDPSRSFAEVWPNTQKSPKLTVLKPDGNKSSEFPDVAAMSNNTALAQSTDTNAIPF